VQWASYPGGEYPFGYYIRPGSTGLARYESGNIGYPAPNGANFNAEGVELSNMCIDCHHSIFNNTDVDATHVKHPVYNSEAAARNTISQGDANGSTVSSHWISGTGAGFLQTPRVKYVVRGATTFAAATTVAATNGVFCLSCHKAHGSNEPFGLVFHFTPGGEGCDQCHNKSAT
jgi:predicted CXXCH cytochrome family protein